MTELNLTEIGDYWNYIQENETEVTTLYYEMLIGVTKFFRDPEAFELFFELFKQVLVDTAAEGEDCFEGLIDLLAAFGQSVF